jgi:hypothetical protein
LDCDYTDELFSIFEPANQQKKRTEIMMKQFTAEIKGNIQTKKSYRASSKKKAFEEEFLDKFMPPATQGIECVVAAVESTWTAWEARPKKFGMAGKYFRQFADRLEDFKAVFDCLPNDNLYTSTLYGALSLVIKVGLVPKFWGRWLSLML